MIVGIEGPCCAGKTTLSKNLAAHYGASLCVVPDYSDFVGGGKHLPSPFPQSIEEELLSLEHFEQLERDRLFQNVRNPELPLIVIDRCVHTLLAHCYSLTQKSGLALFEVATGKVKKSLVFRWPAVLIYIDTPQATISERNKGKFSAGSIFVDAEFNRGFREYFLPEPRYTPCSLNTFCVDGTGRPDFIADRVIQYLGGFIKNQ